MSFPQQMKRQAVHHFREEANNSRGLPLGPLFLILKTTRWQWRKNKKKKSTGDTLLFLIGMATAVGAGAQKQVVAKCQAAAP